MTDYGISPGTLVGDDYEIVRPLSSGGMGSIYVARQRSINVLRALKLMNAPIVQNAEMRERFVREARIGASVGSDHVVQVINAGVDRGTGLPWIAMELLEGRTLSEHMQLRPTLASHEISTIWLQLCTAIAAAHEKNIVHRDIKPENIFLARTGIVGMPFIVKVLDFGIAKLAAENMQNTLQAGSPLYMSPEQTSQSAIITRRTDVWALGLVAFLLFTGKHFWRSAYGDNPSVHGIIREAMVDALPPASVRAAEYGRRESLPAGFDAWFAKCVARQSEERYPDARIAGDQLLELLGSEARVSHPQIGQTLSTPRPSSPSVPSDRAEIPPPRPSAPTPDPVATSEFIQRSQQEQLNLTPVGPPPVQPPLLAPTAEYASRTGNTVSSTIVPQRSRAMVPIVAVAGLLAASGILYLLVGRTDSGSGSASAGELTGTATSIPASSGPATGSSAAPALPEGMIALPGGSLQLPADAASGTFGREAVLAPFAIDANEVTTARYAACVSSGKCTDASAELKWEGAAKAAVEKWSSLCNARASDRGAHPINCVTWDQAKTYCESSGKRLPTEEEWQFAARGKEGRPNPWGPAALTVGHANLCDDACVKLAAEVSFTWQPYIGGSDGYAGTAPIGAFKQGDSPDGVHDLVGNVSEWTGTHLCDSVGTECQEYVILGGGFMTKKGDPFRKHSPVGASLRQRRFPMCRLAVKVATESSASARSNLVVKELAMPKRTLARSSIVGLVLTGFAGLASCGPGEVPPATPSAGYVTAVYQECQEQGALGDATTCWKLFLQSYGKYADAAQLAFAKARIDKAAIESRCSPGLYFNGSVCTALCKEANLESWDNGEGVCVRKVEMLCAQYYHQEEGHCIADPMCPDGMRLRASGGCERIPLAPAFAPGERVISLVDQDDGGKIVVKRGETGTYWATDDELIFVIWDTKVGASPVYPGPETGVPQGKNAYAYWVEAKDVIKDLGGMLGATTLIPEWCGQRTESATYGRISVGTMVKLGKHRPIGGQTNWAPDMDQYVGQNTKVTELLGTDLAGCPCVKVTADKGVFAWRIRDLALGPVVTQKASTKPKIAPGTEPQ